MGRHKMALPSLIVVVVVVIVFLVSSGCTSGRDQEWTLPNLPQPIAREEALITSAGQSSDAYIVAEIANQLLINNTFLPRAQETDLVNKGSLLVVVGYSPTGIKAAGITFQDEINRLERLLTRAAELKIKVIVLHLGGKQRRNYHSDMLLELAAQRTDYLIGVRTANHDGWFTDLAHRYGFPLTLVQDLTGLKVPFTSIFR